MSTGVSACLSISRSRSVSPSLCLCLSQSSVTVISSLFQRTHKLHYAASKGHRNVRTDWTFPTFSENTQVTLCCSQRTQKCQKLTELSPLFQRTHKLRYVVSKDTDTSNIGFSLFLRGHPGYNSVLWTQQGSSDWFRKQVGVLSSITLITHTLNRQCWLSSCHPLACVTLSLPCFPRVTLKTTSKCAKSEIVKAFFRLLVSRRKAFYQNAQCW